MSAKKSFQDRLREHTDTSDPSSCWIWGGWIDRHGYGQTRADGGKRLAHRISYLESVGPIPAGLQIDHLCRVRACVNPAHLEAVTPRVNTLRGESRQARNARKTKCDNGHLFTPDNTYVYRGARQCRACNRQAAARSAERRRAA